MSIQIVHASDGYEFRPTYLGRVEGKIANRYSDTYPNCKYRKTVPKSWVSKGYVEEVKEDVDTDR